VIIDIKLPDVGTTTDEVEFVRWIKNVGDEVKRGEPLLEVETDKSLVEVESIASGKLLSHDIQPGVTVRVGDLLAQIETGATAGQAAKVAPVKTETRPVQEAVAVPNVTPPAASTGTRTNKREGIGMFERNRLRRADAGEKHPGLTKNQQTVARRMQQSKQTIPHFYLQRSARAEKIVEHREQAGEKIAWDAYFARALCHALREYPRLSTQYEDGVLRPVSPDNIGIAVDIDDDLFVITLEEPLGRSIVELSRSIYSKVEAIRQGDESARRMQASAATISNLGSTGLDSFTAIINPPQACILALGRIADFAVVENGELKIRKMVQMSLSVDHRVASGKVAAQFLASIVNHIETFKE
jgi:pyruvate dehydrogenase E2 component (dihydrolipoamide acetyltransferase)